MSEQINTDTSPVVEEVCRKTHYSASTVDDAAIALYRHGFTVRKTIDVILECADADIANGCTTSALHSFIQAMRPAPHEEPKQYVKPTKANDFKGVPGMNRKARRDAQYRRGAWA